MKPFHVAHCRCYNNRNALNHLPFVKNVVGFLQRVNDLKHHIIRNWKQVTKK